VIRCGQAIEWGFHSKYIIYIYFVYLYYIYVKCRCRFSTDPNDGARPH
jgi:hypothetical protein